MVMTAEDMATIIGAVETTAWMIAFFAVVIPIRNGITRWLDSKADAERARQHAAEMAAETFRKSRL